MQQHNRLQWQRWPICRIQKLLRIKKRVEFNLVCGRARGQAVYRIFHHADGIIGNADMRGIAKIMCLL